MRIRTDQRGEADKLLIPLIVSIVFNVLLIGFSIYAYAGLVDNRDNVDSKIASAVEEANAAQKKELEAQFAEEEKNPLKEWKSSDTIGGITIKYPKTWGAYVEENVEKNSPLEAYFHPDFVRDTSSETADALIIEYNDVQYEDEIDDYVRAVEKGDLKSRSIKISGVTGTRLDGILDRDGKVGTKILFPLRSKTLIITSESETYKNDLNNIILKNLSFTP